MAVQHMPVKARITLKLDGPRTHNGRGRPMRQGESITITDVADILYYHGTGYHDVVIIQGRLPAIQGEPEAPEPEAPELELPEEQPEDAEEAPPEGDVDEDAEPEAEEQDDTTEEQDGGDEGEPADEGGEDEPEAGEEQAVEGDTLYKRAELEALSKNALIQLAERDKLEANGQPLKLNMSMNKPAMIDAIMAAQQPSAEG